MYSLAAPQLIPGEIHLRPQIRASAGIAELLDNGVHLPARDPAELRP